MKETVIEYRLKRLESYGFRVLRLVTPGIIGSMDRLILWPTYAPASPGFLELKQPGKTERPLQAAKRDNWRDRGCKVFDMCDTIEKVDALVEQLKMQVEFARQTAIKLGGKL